MADRIFFSLLLIKINYQPTDEIKNTFFKYESKQQNYDSISNSLPSSSISYVKKVKVTVSTA